MVFTFPFWVVFPLVVTLPIVVILLLLITGPFMMNAHEIVRLPVIALFPSRLVDPIWVVSPI